MIKKALASLMLAGLVTSGLTAASTTTAVAAEYPGTVFTYCDVGGTHNVLQGRRIKTNMRVNAPGKARPSGILQIRYSYLKGPWTKTKTVPITAGVRKKIQGPKRTRTGKYRVNIRFIPQEDSVYKACKDQYSFQINKKRKR